MTISELVKKMLDAGATSEVIEIAVKAIEQEREEEQPARRRRKTKLPIARAA